MTTEHIAVAVSWFVVLVWVGLFTYFIDMVGVMMEWWTNNTFFGVPKDKR